MFVKFGEKEHMLSLKENGAMWFNPCKKFREWEKEDGIKDCDDGGIRAPAETIRIVDQEGNTKVAKDISFGLTVEPAYKVPVFCLYQTSENFLSDEKIRKIRQKFPDYDSALLIEDEFAFLENVRYSFKSRAFCHTIFYQDKYEMEFVDFLEKGESDVSFYKPQKKNRYYADVKYDPLDGKGKFCSFRIDDSNFYKTMFTKHLDYQDQNEYRIVLPYERIDGGTSFTIQPFEAKLISIV